MRYQLSLYTGLLIVSACMSMTLALFSLIKRRNAKGAISFILSMFVVTIWSGGNALEMQAINFDTKLFWANVQYFGYCYSPVVLLSLCMQFTGYDKWVKNRKIFWLAVLPTITIVLVWTDGLHGLIRYNMHMDYAGLFPVIAKEYGPFFYIHAFYSHLLNIVAWCLLIKAVYVSNTVYRKQIMTLLIGVSLIVIPNLLYITGYSPVKRHDITPVFFGPAGLILAWSIFRYKMFDLVPLARNTLIENMDAGMMVLDLQNRVIDMNPSCENILNITIAKAAAKSMPEICGQIPELVNACIDRNIRYTEFTLTGSDSNRLYEAFLSPITDSKGIFLGRLALINEITEKKQAQQELIMQQYKLAAVEERERLAKDLHDNLGQVLGFINLQAQGIRKELLTAGVDMVTDKLDKLVEVTQSTHNEIREYIRNARNTNLCDQKFIDTLKKNMLNFEKQAGIPIAFDTNIGLNEIEMPPDLQYHILSITKEALNNVQKHSRAGHVKVGLFIEQMDEKHELLYLAIEDDGEGFVVAGEKTENKNTFGLNIIRERAVEIGADIDIESTVGKGSKIILRVPMIKGVSK